MDALPPDPYLALGVAKDATTAAIKTQYRKLVLKCHPDKVEEGQKQDAADRFHKIQTAYEIIGDEERRSRYDAQCKLAELRKEAMERGGPGGTRGGVEVRTAGYKMPTETARGEFYARGPERYARASPQYDTHYEPQYEERRPSYAQDDYFDHQPRTTSRKYDDYERSSKRSPPKEERAKTKTSRDTKENERSSRKEKSRRTEKDVRRDRDRKSANASVEEVDSDESAGKKARKARAEEEEKLREQREQSRAAAEKFYEQVRREKEAAENGAYTDERANKLFRDQSHAYDYINRSRNTTDREPEERPPPVRAYSSKDKVEYIKREGRPTISVRRGSEKIPRQDSRRNTRDREEVVVEPQERSRRTEARDGRRPPTLAQTKSAPPEEMRPGVERQRSYSVQEDYFDQPIPQVKRSETMPTSPAAVPSRDSRGRKSGSKLRPEDSYATPERTPEPESKASRYQYGHGQSYADDGERCTPDGYVVDGYRTEVREPSGKRYTRSPSPIKDQSRDRQRSSSNKKAAPAEPPPLPRTTSHQYRYSSREDSYPARPPVSRENSGRREEGARLYGEVRTTSSPRQSGYAYSPPPEKVSTSRAYTPDDVKFQTGYSRRAEKPSYHRSASARQAVY